MQEGNKGSNLNIDVSGRGASSVMKVEVENGPQCQVVVNSCTRVLICEVCGDRNKGRILD
jgi:hypothetical protein